MSFPMPAAALAAMLLSAPLLTLSQLPVRSAAAETEIRLTPDDPAAVARGKAVYAEACASCHGADLEGQENWRRRRPDGRLPAPPHDESGHTWHHPDAQLFALTKQGPAALVGGGYQSDMPGYDGVLTDRQILDVLSYIKSSWPARVRQQHDRINAAAAGTD